MSNYGITLAQAEAELANALAAHAKVTQQGQSYGIDAGGGGRRLVRAELNSLLNDINFWDAKVKQLSLRATGRGRSRTIVVGG